MEQTVNAVLFIPFTEIHNVRKISLNMQEPMTLVRKLYYFYGDY